MIERRGFKAEWARAAAAAPKDGARIIRGHASVFNQLSEDLGGYRELVKPGAFANSINIDDVRALWNHNDDLILGRNIPGTLRLSEDEIGLACEIDLGDTQCGRDAFEHISRGDVSHMSFGFTVLREDLRFDGAVWVRELQEVRLFDVSPVVYPAYVQTDLSVRSEARSLFQAKVAAANSAAKEAAASVDLDLLYGYWDKRLSAVKVLGS